MAYSIDRQKQKLKQELVSIDADFHSVFPAEVHGLDSLNKYLKTAIASNRIIITTKKPLFADKIAASLQVKQQYFLMD